MTTDTATNELSKAGLPTMTLQRFLLKAKDKNEDLSNTVLIVDEASMISTSQMKALITYANKAGTRGLVLVGDTKQLGAVAAGSPFEALQKAGLSTARMEDVRRQNNAGHRQAVIDLAQGKVDAALERLKTNIVETPIDALAARAASDWLELSQAQRHQAALIAPTHALCMRITDHVRAGLKSEGTISEDGVTIDTLRPVRLSETEKRDTSNYHSGQVLVFRDGHKSLGLERGARLQVKREAESGELLLEDGTGQHQWSPEQHGTRGVEVFTVQPLEIAEGDRIRWTRNDPHRRFVNSEFAAIEKIEDENIQFKSETGERFTLHRKDPALAHMTHGWANTLHAMQGRTVERAIVAKEARHAHLTDQKAFYVAVSRSREAVTIVTDDAEALGETLALKTGEKTNALDILASHSSDNTDFEREHELELER